MEPYQYNAHHDQETATPIPNTMGMGMGMGIGGVGGGLISSKYSGSSSSAVSSTSSASSSSMVCRQSSTRWIPTSEQIRILRDLYYNCGIRSPTSEQIQRISATLRRYGKIEGKNVFYWFQNHKARERQKKRLSVDPNAANAAAATAAHDKAIAAAAAVSVSSPCVSPGAYGVGHILENSVYDEGSMIRERSFREYCCMTGGAAVEGGEERESNNNASWVGVDTAAADAVATATAQWMHYCPDRHAAASAAREIETLPLFPTSSGGGGSVLNGEEEEEEEEEQEVYGGGANWTEQYMQANLCHNHGHDHGHGHGHGAASLELTLSSYYCSPPPGSM